jgi:PPP family 3-phenylpropionic acid transporter
MTPATRLRLLYFLYYGGVGAFLPYFAPYLRGLGFSGGQIGLVQMLSPVIAPAAAIGWAALADRTGAPERALQAATTISLAAALVLPLAGTPLAVAGVVALLAVGDRAVVPLLDTLTLDHVRSTPGASYGPIRLAGSLGFLGASLALGLLLSARGDRPADVAVPLTVLLLVAGYAATARTLPHAPPPEGPRPGWRDLAGLARDPRLMFFLATCALHWLSTAPFHLLFGVHVRDLGLPASVTGLGMAVGVVAEVLVLFLSPRLEGRFPLRALFAAAFAGSALRWALLWRAEGAVALVTLQALHGLTFGLFWAAAVQAMSALVPPRLRASGQALFTAVVFGVGNGLGYALSGAGYDRLGGVAPLFLAAAVVEALPLLAALGPLGEPRPRRIT